LAAPTDSDRPANRLPLPEGTLSVGLGLLIAGVSSYAFFKVGQLALGKEDFKPIVALWFATFILAPGFFLPLEQELGRAIAHRRALGQGGLPVVRRIVPLGLGMATIVIIFVLALAPVLTSEFFEGEAVVTLALVIAFAAYAPAHLARGICSGTGRFGSYGVVMGADGLARILACVVLWVIGVETVGSFAMIVAIAPLTGVAIVASRGALRTRPGPEASWSEVTPNLGWLLLGSVLAAGLVNAGPIAITLLATSGESAKVTQFGNGVLLARVPLFLFQAVQAALLPRLARLAAQGDLTEFRAGFRRLMVVVIAVGALGVTGAFLLGTWALEVVYEGGLGRRDLTLLALGSAVYMVALATAQAVIALHGHALVAAGWVAGMVSFIAVTAVSSDDLYLRVELGLVASSVAALAVFTLALRSLVRSGARADEGSILEAVTDFPLEG
jgi:O-antigen/teichoic acid export membrane protein